LSDLIWRRRQILFESEVLIHGWTRCGRLNTGQKQPVKREEPVRISPAGCIMKKSMISNINLQNIVYGLNMSIL